MLNLLNFAKNGMTLILVVLGVLLLWLMLRPVDEVVSEQNSISNVVQRADKNSLVSAIVIVDENTKPNNKKSVRQKPDSKTQRRFEKANNHLKRGQWAKAEKEYKQLINNNPQLVESYINLSSVYAKNNQLDKARETLMQGLTVSPNYRVLSANLQKIQGAIAANAYRQALNEQVEPISAINLTTVNSIDVPAVVNGKTIREVTPIDTKSDTIISGLKNQIIQLQLELSTAKQDAVVAKRNSAKPVIEKIPTPKVTTSAISVGVPKVTPKPVQTITAVTEIQKANAIKLVQSWATAWSKQDVDSYISHYRTGYTAKAGVTHQQWRNDRQLKLTNKKFIDVNVRDFKVRDLGNKFEVFFIQHYKANTFDDTIGKKLLFNKSGVNWLDSKVVRETVVRNSAAQ